MAIRVRPKVENLQLRSGDVVGPEHEVSVPTDEAWNLYIRGLVEIVCRGTEKRIEVADKPPHEVR
jgi:hypothetical protein